MKKILVTGGKLACLLFLFNTYTIFAQEPPGGGTAPAETPIDGGASLLAAAGLTYGLKKIRDHKRKNDNEEE